MISVAAVVLFKYFYGGQMTSSDPKKQSFKPKHKTRSRTTSIPDNDPKDAVPRAPAPHYDQQESPRSTNTEVEVAKGSNADSFRTDSRPKT